MTQTLLLQETLFTNRTPVQNAFVRKKEFPFQISERKHIPQNLRNSKVLSQHIRTPSREHRVTSTRCPRSREACLRSTRWSPRSRFLRSTRGYRQRECLPRSNLKFSLEISTRKPWELFNPPRTITHRPRPGQRPRPPLLSLLQSTSDTRLQVRSSTASTRKRISPSGGRLDRA